MTRFSRWAPGRWGTTDRAVHRTRCNWPLLGTIAAALVLGAACRAAPGPPPRVPDSNSTVPLGRDFIAFDSDRTGNFEIYVMRLDGSDVHQITSDRRYQSQWPRLSPDRRTILFYRGPGMMSTDPLHSSLWLVGVDGSSLREARPAGTDGWEVQGHGEWAPDGAHMVMHGGRLLNSQIFITDADGRNARAVTSRPGRNLDPSWSPDGRTIVFVGCPGSTCSDRDLCVYTVAASGGEPQKLTADGMRSNDPYFSPDGKRIAWLAETQPAATPRDLGVWNILVMDADGSNQHRLTSDGEVNSVPRWSPDGATIYFHRLEPRSGKPWRLFAIGVDGSGLRELGGQGAGNNENPSL